MKVHEIMTREVVTAHPDTAVNLVARLMAGRGISGIPVVAESGELVGIVTELDMIVRNTRLEPPAFFQILDGRIPLETPAHYKKRIRHMLGALARDVMTEEVVTIAPDEDVEEVASLMVKHRVNPVPVVDGGRLVGIVSRADIIGMMARDLDEAPPGGS
jgi:CBS domain-containing protein